MTYGQIAEILGEGYTPRTIGFVMHGSDDGTPWHRVVNAQGGCSTGRVVVPYDKQQKMLESEGVEFNKGGKCSLETYVWIPGKVGGKPSRERGSLFKGKSSKKGKA